MKTVLQFRVSGINKYLHSVSIYRTTSSFRTVLQLVLIIALNFSMLTVYGNGLPVHDFDNRATKLTTTGFPVRVIKTNVSACGNGSDGMIKVIPEGGIAPYTFSWTGPNGFTSTQEAIETAGIGYYDVVITDANGETATVSGIHITLAFSPYITNNGSVSGSCNNTGSIILYGNAGVQPYTYSLDGINYQHSSTFSNLAPGTYTAYIKDYRGCVSSKQIAIAASAPMLLSTYVRPSSSCYNDGVIELYISGGVGPYTYSLNNINYQETNIFSNLAPNTNYTGWVMDSKGCKVSLSNIMVTQASGLTVSAIKTNSSTCVNDGTISISVTGGSGAYSYSLDDVTYQSAYRFFNKAPGTYTCWAKDSRGCKGSANITIGTNQIVVTATTGSTNSCNINGSIQMYRTGGTGPYMYSLNNINYSSSSLFTGLPGGVYTGWVRDSKGCRASLPGITVVSGYEITATAVKTNSSTCVNNGTITLSPVGGTAPFTFSLNNGTFQTVNLFSQLGAGNYVGKVKDANGCMASVNATINLNPINVNATVTNVTNCSVPDGTIQISHTGGTGGFTYSIDGEVYQSSNLFTGLEEGEYMAFVKDSNICIGVNPDVIVGSGCSSLTGKNKKQLVDDVALAIANLQVRAFPNPSPSEFTLQVENDKKSQMNVIVTDMIGRKVFLYEGDYNHVLRFGKHFKAGLYNVQVIMDNQQKTIRLMKE